MNRGNFMGMAMPLMVAAGIGIVAGGGAVALNQGTDRAKMEAVVRDYILAHPEIIPEAMKQLESRENARLVASQRSALETPFAGAWAGSAQPDVTVVMFTDYNCGYCRRSLPDVERLIAADRGVRVVWREIPILGPASETAARIALTAAKSGSYLQTHRALFARTGTRTEPPADPEIDREIERNLAIARQIGITGTPTFVVGDQLLQGAVGYDALVKAVAQTRKRRG